MKNIIVVNAYIKNASQIMQAERISEEMRKLGNQCEIVKNINLAEIKDGKTVADKVDCCVFLDKDKAAARLFEKCGIKLFNSANAIEMCDNKMLTHIALANCGINMPDTVYSPLCYYKDAEISDIDFFSCGNGNTATVVTAVFQSSQSVQQYGGCLSCPRVAYDSAHR